MKSGWPIDGGLVEVVGGTLSFCSPLHRRLEVARKGPKSELSGIVSKVRKGVRH